MYKNIGNLYIEDGVERPKDAFQKLEIDSPIIYEVVRVINNQILFLDDHMNRLKHSLILTNKSTAIIAEIIRSLQVLIEKHPQLNKNIKVDVYDGHYRCYFMESFYPDQTLYETGVKTTLLAHHRDNPEVKQLNMGYKQMIEDIKGDRYFEVLLEDSEGYVIEGSRSNLIFVKDDTLFSAPLHEILEGITFKNVFKMAKTLGYNICYKKVALKDIKDMDACFITGTSLGVLPIQSINEMEFDSVNNEVIHALHEAYNNQTKVEEK